MILPVFLGIGGFVVGYVTSNLINSNMEEKIIIVDSINPNITEQKNCFFKEIDDFLVCSVDSECSLKPVINTVHNHHRLLPNLAEELTKFNKRSLKQTNTVQYIPKNIICDLRTALAKRRINIAEDSRFTSDLTESSLSE